MEAPRFYGVCHKYRLARFVENAIGSIVDAVAVQRARGGAQRRARASKVS